MENITHPWLIASWPTVHYAVSQRELMIRRLHCVSATLHHAGSGQGRSGQVMWACQTPLGDAALAWDWFDLRPQVVALADPMHVLSNVCFVDEHGVELTTKANLLELNNLVASLRWQDQVEPALLQTQLLRAA